MNNCENPHVRKHPHVIWFYLYFRHVFVVLVERIIVIVKGFLGGTSKCLSLNAVKVSQDGSWTQAGASRCEGARVMV